MQAEDPERKEELQGTGEHHLETEVLHGFRQQMRKRLQRDRQQRIQVQQGDGFSHRIAQPVGVGKRPVSMRILSKQFPSDVVIRRIDRHPIHVARIQRCRSHHDQGVQQASHECDCQIEPQRTSPRPRRAIHSLGRKQLAVAASQRLEVSSGFPCVERRLTKESTTGANPPIPAIRKKSRNRQFACENAESFDKLYHLTIMRRETYNEFRQLCREHNLAATHQRQKIYEALVSRPGHYSPEEIYEQVKQDLPSISLATVYKNLKTFVHAGMLHEVSPHHGSWRIDANRHPHHHLVCTRCRSITDLTGRFARSREAAWDNSFRLSGGEV